MYEYIITDGERTIETNWGIDFKDIKQETLLKSAECIHMRSTYPNGFIFETLIYADKIIYRTNRELRDNGNGTFTVLDK